MKTKLQKDLKYPTMYDNSGYAAHPGLSTDGPYIIYYTYKYGVVKTGETTGAAFYIQQKMCDSKDTMEQYFDCKVDLPQQQNFSFPINPAITIPPSLYSIKRRLKFTHNKPSAVLIEEERFFAIDERGNKTLLN